MKKKVRKKYATGTTVKNYVKDPKTELAENQINISKAKFEAESNPWTNALSVIGNVATQQGLGMLSSMTPADISADEAAAYMKKHNVDEETARGKLSNQAQNIGGFGAALSGALNFFAMGGEVEQNVPVEVEGGETLRLPNGKVIKVEGPDHEKGGVNATLPVGTNVGSKRISIDGETPADAMERMAKLEAKLEKKLKNNYGDALIKKNLESVKAKHKEEQDFINQVQESITMAMGGTAGERPKHGVNPWVGNYANTKPTKEVKDGKKPLSFKINPGDATSVFGTLISTLGPLWNAEQSRATDLPNENVYKGVADDALNTLDSSAKFASQIKDERLGRNELTKAAGIKRAGNASRSLNVQNALKTAAVQEGNINEGKIYSDLATSMERIFGTTAQTQMAGDKLEAGGERERLDRDAADKDAYYTSKSEALVGAGEGVQKLGKDINTMKLQESMKKILSQLHKYGVEFDDDFNLVNS